MATKAEEKIIKTAMKQLKTAVTGDEHNRTSAIEDLKFAHGDQWDSRELTRRSTKGRPALTLNFLPKFVDQVVGDMLHNSPSIKIRPADGKGDNQIAKIRQGIISNIEYSSNSKGIYGYASRQMVTCGYGGWRILTRYIEENPFLQEIYLEGIRNPFLIYLDPASKDQNYADAKWGFLIEKVPTEEFKERWPKAKVPGDDLKHGKGLSDELWYDRDNITVVEYFTRESQDVKMHQLEDGRVVTDDEFKVLTKEWKEKHKEFISMIERGPEALTQPQLPGSPPPSAPAIPPAMQGVPGAPPTQMGGMPQGPAPSPQQPPMLPMMAPKMPEIEARPTIRKSRTTEKTVIKHRIMTCNEILSGGEEGKVFPGKYIPLILLKGKELNIEGKNHVYGLIRNAKDPQKLINYWNTAAAETIALAPKAPWLGTAKQFEGFQKDFASANVDNMPFLMYNPDPEAQGPPMRQVPGQPPVAIFEQIRRGEENLKSVIGMFNADLGAPGSEQTGAAIIARQKPGDIATFEFSENLARAVLHTARIINEMIPEVYDSERDIRVRDLDTSESFVPINTTVGSALESMQKNPTHYAGMDIEKLRSVFSKEGKDAKFNDITVGKYDVVVTIGPSYATQRQEAAQHLLQLTQSMPQQMALATDLLIQNLDFKDADELAARIRKTLPPNIVKPRPGEQVMQPPPNPQVQLAQAKLQLEQGKQKLQMMKIEQEKIKLEHEKVKMQLEMVKLQAEMGGESVDPTEIQERMGRLKLEYDRLELEKNKFTHQQNKDIMGHIHNQDKLDAQTELGLMREENNAARSKM